MLRGSEQSHRSARSTGNKQTPDNLIQSVRVCGVQPVCHAGASSSCSCSWNFKLRRQSVCLRLVFPLQLCGSEHTNTPTHACIGQCRRIEKKNLVSSIKMSLKLAVFCRYATSNPYKPMQHIHTATSGSTFCCTCLTCLHFVLISKHPGASVLDPAGLGRLVPLALPRADAVPHDGGESTGAPTQGLSSRHPAALHQPPLHRRASNTPSRSSRHLKKKTMELDLLFPSRSQYRAVVSLRTVTQSLPPL